MSANENVRSYNVGKSDYAKHAIQPWDIWKEYNLNPWDADIVKRVLRSKEGEARTLDYEKIIHICKYRIAELSKEVLKGGRGSCTSRGRKARRGRGKRRYNGILLGRDNEACNVLY